MKSPEINPCRYSELIFHKKAGDSQREKDNLFNKWCWENLIYTCKRVKLSPYCTWPTQIHLKWIKDLNIRPETIKFLEENIKKKLTDIGLGSGILDMTPNVQETKGKKINFTWLYQTLKLLHSQIND